MMPFMISGPLFLQIVFAALLVALFVGGAAAAFSNPRSSLTQRLGIPLVSAGLVTFAFLTLHKIQSSVFIEQNWMRLGRTIMWGRGYPLYPDVETGPVLNAIYGPLSALAYWPANWVSPLQSVPAAVSCAAVFFFLPVFWLLVCRRDKEPRFLSFSLLGFVCFALAASLFSSLKRSAFSVHADAPALGMAALACGVIYLRSHDARSWKTLWVSALFATLAVWSKQTAAPIVPALLLYIWRTEGLRSFAVYVSAFFVAGIISLAAATAVFDMPSLYYNMVLIPSRHGMGFEDAAKSIFRLFREIALLAVLTLPILWNRFRAPKPGGGFLTFHRWGLFWWVALWMSPFALMAHIKIGGSNNTLSFATYFMLLGTILAFLETARRHPDTAVNFRARSAMVIYTAVLILVTLPLVFYRLGRLQYERSFAAEALAYAAAHPGTSYFPRMPVIHLFAEGKLYHESEGLTDREWAGFTVGQEQFLAHIPKNLTLIGFAGENHRRVLPLGGFAIPSKRNSSLPGFTVYTQELLT